MTGPAIGYNAPMGAHSELPEPSEERVAIGVALPGLEIHPLDEGSSAVEVFVLVKVLDSDGMPTWAYRTSRSPNREELLGALTVQVDVLRRELVREWDDDE